VEARRYSETQVFRILKEVDSGTAVEARGFTGYHPSLEKQVWGGVILSELKRPQGTGRGKHQAEADHSPAGAG